MEVTQLEIPTLLYQAIILLAKERGQTPEQFLAEVLFVEMGKSVSAQFKRLGIKASEAEKALDAAISATKREELLH